MSETCRGHLWGKIIVKLLYIFFWVFHRRQIVVGRRFGTLYQFHLQRLGVHSTPYISSIFKGWVYTVQPAFEDGTDTGFRNVGQLQFDAGEIPRRKYTIFKSRRKSEINIVKLFASSWYWWVSQVPGSVAANTVNWRGDYRINKGGRKQ